MRGDGAKDNDLTFEINIKCVDENGVKNFDFEISDEIVREAYANRRYIRLNVNGVNDSYDYYVVEIVIKSALGVEWRADIYTFTPAV